MHRERTKEHTQKEKKKRNGLLIAKVVTMYYCTEQKKARPAVATL